jgi:hypothetical protein
MMRWMRAVTLVFLMLSGVTLASAQTPTRQPGNPRDNPQQKTGTARLSGRVLAADTGKPLRRAVVQVPVPGASDPRWVWTDQDGRWQIGQLPPGRYTLTASKSGYLTLRYGQLRAFEPGKTLEVADGQVLENLSISLPRGGVIAGRIFDEFGDPLSGAHVGALRYRYADGQRRLTPITEGFEALLSGVTDDIGQYRLHGLPPGEYYVAVATGPPAIPSGQSDDRTGYVPSYYPGTAALGEAQRVIVGVGQEAQNVSFAVTPIRFATISGTVVNSSGQPVHALNIRLSAADASPTSGRGTGQADGTFLVTNVAPGDYRLRLSHGPMGRQEVASMPITVAGQDITGLALVTAPGATATGRVIFEGQPETTPRTVVGTFSVDQGSAASEANYTQPRADGTFEIRGLWDRQLFRSSGGLAGGPLEWTENSSGWFLKSVTLEGKDITDSGYEFKPGETVSGIDIVLTERVTTLSGTVLDDRGRPIGDYTVVAFSADSSKWGYRSRFVRTARPDQNGKFILKGLPADEYRIVALEYVEPGEETDPVRLEKWKTIGTRVTLADAATKSVTLQLAR